MSLLYRYAFRQLFTFFLALTLGLGGLAVLTRSLSIIELVVNYALPMSMFFYMIGLLLPSLLQVLVPVALGIACIFVFNKMHADNEIMIYQASGLSLWRLASPLVVLGFVVGMLASINAGFIMPWAFERIDNVKAGLGTRFAASLLEPGQFIDVGKGKTLYFESVRDGEMKDLMIRDETRSNVPTTIFAQSGHFMDVDGQSFVVLKGVDQIGFDEKSGQPFRLKATQQSLEVAKKQEPTKRANKRNKAKTLPELHEQIASSDEGRNRNNMRKYYHSILSAFPFTFAVTLLIGFLMLNVGRSRQGLGKRLWIAVFVLVLFTIFDILAENAINKGGETWVFIYLNTLLAFVLAFILPGALKRFGL